MTWQKIKSTLKLPKFGVFTNLFNNLLCSRNLVILAGDYGLTLIAFKYDRVIDNLFITVKKSKNDEPEYDSNSYQKFLTKYKSANIFFLIASSDQTIHHELLPILPSIVGNNPIKHFIAENFYAEDIVAYNVYNITTNANEELHTVFASTPYTPLMAGLLDCILKKKLNFAGIYFLSLEIQTIIDNLLKTTGNSKYGNYLQICVTILKAGGIKFVVKHKKNILDSKFMEYHADKSYLYLAGQIEEEINTYLIFFKNYAKRFNLKTCIIFLAPLALKEPLQQINPSNSQILHLSGNEISKDFKHTNSEESGKPFADTQIIQLFNQHKSFLGLNNSLQAIMQINFLNLIIFKPLLIITVILLCVLVNLKIHTTYNHYKKDAIDKEYYKVAKKYHEIKEKYPNIYETINIADIYFFERLLARPVQTPFEMLEKFLASLNKKVHVKNISWSFSDANKLSAQHVRLNTGLKLINNSPSIEQSNRELDDYMNNLQLNFKGFNIDLTKSPKTVIKTTNRVIIPFEIRITKEIKS